MKKSKRAKVMAKTGSLCWYCGKDACEVDHVVPFHLPKKRRGEREGMKRSDINNLLPSCVPCNRKKGNRSLDEFRQLRGRFWGERFLPPSSLSTAGTGTSDCQSAEVIARASAVASSFEAERTLY